MLTLFVPNLCRNIVTYDSPKQKTKFTGIKMKEKEILFSQFAADITLCLDGGQKSLNESIQISKDLGKSQA